MYRLLAVKMMFQNPEAFGFSVPERYPYIAPRKVITVTDSDVDLVELAKSYGITYADLKRANLWLRGLTLVNSNKKSYRIIIPDAGQ